MTYLFVGIALVVSAGAAAILLARHRPARVVSLQPRPEIFRSIRLLQDDDEIRAAARRAYERERWIAHQADRRGAHFRQLTGLQPDLAPARVIGSRAARDRELRAGDA